MFVVVLVGVLFKSFTKTMAASDVSPPLTHVVHSVLRCSMPSVSTDSDDETKKKEKEEEDEENGEVSGDTLLAQLLKGAITFPAEPIAIIIAPDGAVLVLTAAEAELLLNSSPLVGEFMVARVPMHTHMPCREHLRSSYDTAMC